jgi:holo-[acyl-carrier protein] synthase
MTTGVRCGVDVTSVARIEHTLHTAGAAFADRVWSRAELADCDGNGARLAKLWVAKEAALKVLGVGVDTLEPADIVVRKGPTGEPSLVLSPAAQAIADEIGIESISVSMSREADVAIAIVTALVR